MILWMANLTIQRTMTTMWTKQAEVPAQYSEEDPLDVDGMQSMADDLDSQWWHEHPNQQRQAIANSFRAAATSPRQNLKWNSIVYQHLMHLPPHNSDPQEFENTIRSKKEEWDRFGQSTLDLINQNSKDADLIAHAPNIVEKYQPGIWGNIRRAAAIGPYVENLRQAAIEDVGQGGSGRYYRNRALNLGIKGFGPKQ